MTQHLLHAAQVGTALEQVGGHGVTQAVRAQVRRVGHPGQGFVHQPTHHALVDSAAPIAHEHRGAGALGRQQIAVEVSSVLRASPDSFRVAWIEKRYENGQLAGSDRWTAILTIVIQTPRDAERLRANPLGIYVNAISWSREMAQ